MSDPSDFEITSPPAPPGSAAPSASTEGVRDAGDRAMHDAGDRALATSDAFDAFDDADSLDFGGESESTDPGAHPAATIEPAHELTHFDDQGAARMVDVGAKQESEREAVATGAVEMAAATLARVQGRDIKKGDVLGVARIAAIGGVKRAAELIPLCHPLRVTGVDIEFTLDEAASRVGIRATVRAFDRTGVEMEALTAVTVAALTIYDMCKAIDRGMRIVDVQLEHKRGGKSGHWQR